MYAKQLEGKFKSARAGKRRAEGNLATEASRMSHLKEVYDKNLKEAWEETSTVEDKMTSLDSKVKAAAKKTAGLRKEREQMEID